MMDQDQIAKAREIVQRVAEGKAAREFAKQLHEMVKDEIQLNKDIRSDLFWSAFAKLVDDRLLSSGVKQPPADKMTDDESKRFGKQLIPYGVFRGKPIDSIPLDRLCWYADQRFTDEIRLTR